MTQEHNTGCEGSNSLIPLAISTIVPNGSGGKIGM